MLKIRRPLGRLIFNMGIAIPGKTIFLIETAPWSLCAPKAWYNPEWWCLLALVVPLTCDLTINTTHTIMVYWGVSASVRPNVRIAFSSHQGIGLGNVGIIWRCYPWSNIHEDYIICLASLRSVMKTSKDWHSVILNVTCRCLSARLMKTWTKVDLIRIT